MRKPVQSIRTLTLCCGSRAAPLSRKTSLPSGLPLNAAEPLARGELSVSTSKYMREEEEVLSEIIVAAGRGASVAARLVSRSGLGCANEAGAQRSQIIDH